MKTPSTTTWPLASLLLLAVAACGNSSSREPASAEAKNAEHAAPAKHAAQGDHDAEHAAMPPTVQAFHDELRPLWHSEKGPARVDATCAHASSLRAKAVAVGDKDLVDRTSSLADECTRDGRPDFEAKLKAVHEQFHVVAKHPEHTH